MPGSTPSENPSRNSKLWNPLTLGVIAAVIGLIGNAVVTFLQGQQDIELKEREFKYTVDIEARKFNSSLFIEAIKTGNQESASKNLQFLLELGFIDDPNGTIRASLEDPSKIPVLPSNVSSPLPNPIDDRWRCVFTLCLGKPLNEVDPTLTWPRLELAVELAPLDVRYYSWVSNKYIPRQLGNELCASPKDEILAFFENEKLARVSLRFHSTDECPDRSKWLEHFARGAETTISDRQGGKFFKGRGNSIFLLGWSGQKVTVVDVALQSSGYISSDEWVAFVKEYLDADSIEG